jgi:hypothetical protein
MLYYIHHPAGTVVILTDNLYIVMHHQNLGWCTTNIVSRAASAVLGAMRATMAILPSYTPSGTATIAPLLASSPVREEEDGEISKESVANCAPVQWITALTRDYYHHTSQLALDIPQAGWIVPAEAPIPFEYRLEQGVWDSFPEAHGARE